MGIRRRIWSAGKKSPASTPAPYLMCNGTCPVCDQATTFVSASAWLRDNFVCTKCMSIPRERALMAVLKELHPNWTDLAIHESSPSDRGASARMARDCADYSHSHYFPGVAPGTSVDGVRSENLESLTFADASFDIVITQDVMEHVFAPDLVFSEIARVLRPGGSHIFTVPITRYGDPSRRRARIRNGEIDHLLPAEYHGNPIDDGGALVTVDWGWDLCEYIFAASGLFTHVFHIDDLSRGIRAAHNEVFATLQPSGTPVTTSHKPSGGL